MKRFFIAATLMAGMLSSCSENVVTEVLPQSDNANLIGLDLAAALTRGTETVTGTLESAGTTNDIDVHYVDNTTSPVKGTLYFKYSSSAWAQTAGTPIKWSDIDLPATFYSLHDGTDNVAITATPSTYTSDIVGDKFTPATDITLQKDLVYFATTVSALPSGSAISGNYAHALTRAMILSNHGVNYIPTYTSVKLKNVAGFGTPTITTSDITWTTTEAATSYTYLNASSSPLEMAANADVANIATSANSATANMLIIPQELTATTATGDGTSAAVTPTGAYVEVIYRMEDANGADVAGYADAVDCPAYDGSTTGALYIKVAYCLSTALEMNNGISYNLNLNVASNGGVLLEDNYVEADGTPTTIPIEPLDPGDTVIPSEGDDIGITIGVTGWSDATPDPELPTI